MASGNKRSVGGRGGVLSSLWRFVTRPMPGRRLLVWAPQPVTRTWVDGREVTPVGDQWRDLD